jgi:FG-GAP repeat
MKQIFVLLICFPIGIAFSQSVGIGTTTPLSSAILELKSTNSGFLPPRMSSTQRLAIASPVNGLMVYDTNTDTFWFYESGKWNELIASNKLAYQLPGNRINPGGDAGDNFGFSVCLGVSGNEGLVGSPMLGNGGNGTCHRITFADNNLWTISSQTVAGLQPGDGYGYAVAMDRNNNGNEGIISAPFDDSSTVTDMGCVYFFDGNTFKNKMYAPLAGRVAGAKFGRSVDISGNNSGGDAFAIVGAPGANSNKGAAYIYQYNPNTSLWDFEATLTDNLGAAADSFGMAVSLYYSVTGDTAWAFVGAPYDDENSVANLGSVTVFRKAAASSLWTRVAKISVPGEPDDIAFGYSIANVMRCGQVVIGAPLKSSGIGVMYSASLSAFSGGVANFTLTEMPAPGGSAGVGTPGLGFTVSAMSVSSASCSSIYAIVGSFSGIISANSSASFGVAFLYRLSGGSWSVLEKLTDPDVETTGYGFGRAVSIHTSSKNMLIGSPNQRVEGMANRGKIQFRKLGL